MTQYLVPVEMETRPYGDYSGSDDDTTGLNGIIGYWSELRLSDDHIPTGYKRYSLMDSDGDVDDDDNDDNWCCWLVESTHVNHLADVLIPDKYGPTLDGILKSTCVEVVDYWFLDEKDKEPLPVSNKALDGRYAVAHESDEVTDYYVGHRTIAS